MGTHDALRLDRRAVGFGSGDCICVAKIEILNCIENRIVKYIFVVKLRKR